MIVVQLAGWVAELVLRHAAQQVDAGTLVADGDHQGWGVGGVVEVDEGDHQPPAGGFDRGGLNFDPLQAVGSAPDLAGAHRPGRRRWSWR